MKIIKLLLLLLWSGPVVLAQEVKMIKIKKGSYAAKPTHFYIAAVVDARADTSRIGMMRAGLMNRPTEVNLLGGAAHAFTEYIARKSANDRSLKPLSLTIEELKIIEKGGTSTEQATIDYNYAFYDGKTRLVSYSGNAYVQTGLDASRYIEQLIRQSIDHTLSQADDQWAQLAPLTKPAELAVNVVFEEPNNDPNLIYYHRNQPLSTADFKGKPDDLSNAAAATAYGLTINFSAETNGNKTVAKIALGVFADASKSWMRPRAKNPIVLSHEQAHFDIAAIAACHLRNALMKQSYTPERLQEQVMTLYREAEKALRAEQDRYDTETLHGLKKKEQANWKSNLDSQLASQDCF